MSIHRLTHIGICVGDLSRSAEFYRDALGFREVGRYSVGDEATEKILEVKDVQLELLYLERDGVRIELLYYPSPGHVGSGERRAMNALGLTHLSFAVEDIDRVGRAIEAAGGRVLEETRAAFKSGNRGLFATDPDGTRIELIERIGDPGAIPGIPSDP
ncbi:MAG: VOC family protein [Gemmatimonadota bacterium]|jgi:glyoxylase I family protein